MQKLVYQILLKKNQQLLLKQSKNLQQGKSVSLNFSTSNDQRQQFSFDKIPSNANNNYENNSKTQKKNYQNRKQQQQYGGKNNNFSNNQQSKIENNEEIVHFTEDQLSLLNQFDLNMLQNDELKDIDGNDNNYDKKCNQLENHIDNRFLIAENVQYQESNFKDNKDNKQEHTQYKSFIDTNESINNQINRAKSTVNSNMSLSQAIYCGKLFIRTNYQGWDEWNLVLNAIGKQNEEIDFSSQLAEILWVTAKSFGNKDIRGQVYNKMEKQVIINKDNVNVDDLSIIAWSYAKNKQGSEKFWMILIEKLAVSVQNMNFVDVSNTCWSLTQLNGKFDNQTALQHLWDALLSKISLNINNLSDEQCFSIIISSVARGNKGNTQFWKEMGNKFEQLSPNLSNQGIANSIWALGRKNVFEIQNWLKIEKIVLNRIPNLQYKEIMAISWGCIKMEFGTQPFWSILLQKMEEFLSQKDLDKLDYPTISSCAYILSQLNQKLESHWILIDNVIMQKQQELNQEQEEEEEYQIQDENLNDLEKEKITETEVKIEQLQIEISTLTTLITAFSSRQRGSKKLWEFFENQAIIYMQNHIDLIKKSQENLIKNQNENNSVSIQEKQEMQENQEKKNMEVKKEVEKDKIIVKNNININSQQEIDFDSKIVTNLIYGLTGRNMAISHKLKRIFIDFLTGNLNKLSLQGLLVCFSAFIKRGQGIINKFRIQEDKNIKILADEFILNIYNKRQDIDIRTPPDLGMLLYSLSKLQYQESEKIKEIFRYFEEQILKEISKNQNKQDMGIFMGELDISHVLVGFDAYDMGSKIFWEQMEKITIQMIPRIQEESNASILLRVGKKRFGQLFFDTFQRQIEINCSKYRVVMLINILNSYRGNKFVHQDHFFVIEKQIMERLIKNKLSLQEVTEVLFAFTRNYMGTHQFYFQAGQYMLTQFKKELVSININNVEQRAIFSSLLEISAHNPQIQTNQELFSIIYEGCKMIIKSRFLKMKELSSFINSLAKLRYGDPEIWNILEKKMLYFQKGMNYNVNMRLLIRIRSMKKGSPQFYEKQFLYFDSIKEKIDTKTLVQFCSIQSDIQQLFYNLYINKLVFQHKENFQEYILQVHQFCSQQEQDGEAMLIEKLNFKDFHRLNDDFWARINHLQKQEYTMKINEIISVLNQKKSKKLQLMSTDKNDKLTQEQKRGTKPRKKVVSNQKKSESIKEPENIDYSDTKQIKI